MKYSKNSDYIMYTDIFTIDHRINGCLGKYESQLTFSFLYWSLIE